MEMEKQDFGPDSRAGSRVALQSKPMRKHCPLRIANIIFSCLMFCLAIVFNSLMGQEGAGVYEQSLSEQSEYFYFEITPAGWAFSIWGLIYLMQGAFLIYGIASIFRKTSEGPLYVSPGVIPFPIYTIYSVNLLLNISWLLTFDRKLIVLSLVMLLAIPCTLAACLAIAFYYVKDLISFLKNEGQRWEMILLNIVAYNSWAVYMGWTICATLLNFGMVLIYSAGLGQETTGLIALSILLIMLLIFFPLEVTILDKYLRYVIMHYIGPMVALAGSVVKAGANDKGIVPSGVNRTYAAVILGILLLCFVLKMLNLGIRCWKQPLYYDNACSCADKSEKKTEIVA